MESFAGATTPLNMGTSAVSQQISALEKSLGTELFTRGPRSVTLSEAGFQFLLQIRQALASIESSAAAIRGRSKASVVRVMANSIFAMSWLAPRLTDFAEKGVTA